MSARPAVTNDGRNSADHRQCVPDSPERTSKNQHPDWAADAQAEHPYGYRPSCKYKRSPQVVSDKKSCWDIGAQAGEPKGTRNGAQRKVANRAVAPNLGKKNGECPDCERAAENEQAKKDNGPGHEGRQRLSAYETESETCVSAVRAIETSPFTCSALVAQEQTKRW